MVTPVRVYLTGRVCVEAGETLLDGQELPGRQGRLGLAYLVVERARAVTRDELAEVLWPDGLPRSWGISLSAVVSNLRRALGKVGLARAAVIGQAFGCYQLRLPPEGWVDVEAAAHAIDQAEGALRAGDPMRAYGWAGVATAIARRNFLPGEDGPWVEQRRADLHDVLVRGLDCFTEVLIWSGEARLAIRAAAEAVAKEPFREKGYRGLMRAHAADGDRAESLRVYQRCRTILAEELGVDPSPQTEAVYLELLRLS